MAQCQEMKEQKQLVKADRKAQHEKLTAQLSEMNRASKDKKVGLMANALTNMVEQRIAMGERKSGMEEKMMMQHIQLGKESMMDCPMMKDMDKGRGMKDHQH